MSSPRIPYGFLRLLTVALVVVLAAPSLSGAGKWKMATEAKPVYYKMQSTSYNRRGEKQVVVEVDISATEQKDDKGQPMFLVKTSQTALTPARDLQGGAMAFGAFAAGWAGVAGMQWMMYQPLLTQLDLVVGEKMSYFGGMLAKVTAKETIAGHEGFVVQILNTSKEEPVLMAELVVNPDISIALRSRAYSKGKISQENLLLDYKAR